MPSFISEVLTEVDAALDARLGPKGSTTDRVVDVARLKVTAWRARLAELASWGFRFAVAAALLSFAELDAVVLGVFVLAAIGLAWRLEAELLARGRRGWAVFVAVLAVAGTAGVVVGLIALDRPGAAAFFAFGEVCASVARHDRAMLRRASRRTDLVVAA